MSTPPRHDTAPIQAQISLQQEKLVHRIRAVNTPGNLEGLFAFHVIGDDAALPFSWTVNCATDEWIAENRERQGEFPILAVLGYALSHSSHTTPPIVHTTLTNGLALLRRRDPFPEDRFSFAYHPLAFLGLALGARALGETGLPYLSWFGDVLGNPRRTESTPYQALLYSYIRHVLTGDVGVIDDVRRYTAPEALALLEWSLRKRALQLVDPRTSAPQLQAQVLHAALITDCSLLDSPRAALIWSAVHSSLLRSIDASVLSRDHVATVLRRFEDALRRWRWDDPEKVREPIRWPIISEREVQDLVWLVLRSLWEEVVDEDTLPKLGHSTYRADFGLPSLRLLVEVKFCRHASDFKAIEKEIMEDAAAYLIQATDRYERILVFIYDHSASVQEHGLTADALGKLPQVEDVIIVSRPSQLPGDLKQMTDAPVSRDGAPAKAKRKSAVGALNPGGTTSSAISNVPLRR